MNNLKDIYSILNLYLMNNNFYSLEIEEKKQKVIEGLTFYLQQKLISEALPDNTQNRLESYIDILTSNIPKENQLDVLSPIIHFLLGIMSSMQGWEIVWWIESAEQFIDNPLIKYTEDDKVDSLTTHNETEFKQIFLFVQDFFLNQFCTIKNKPIQLRMKDRH